MGLPTFLVIGSMKCGTSTLQEQLKSQRGIFMTTPEEPNYFSDEDIFAKGIGWYESLFDTAEPGDLLGESSTHYTKLPTYPHCVERIEQALGRPKLIYLIRNPVERAKSHYMHEWTMGVMGGDPEAALKKHPVMVDYGRYAMQLKPYIEAFGVDKILMTSLETLSTRKEAELARIGEFLGVEGPFEWFDESARLNASAERIRRFPLYGMLIESRLMTVLRRTLVPQRLRQAVKSRLQITKRPEFSAEVIRALEAEFTKDYLELKTLFPDWQALDLSYPFINR